MEPLEIVFDNLDRWRHLPAYQLERRADIFFSVYLKGLLEQWSGDVVDDVILPELPISRALTHDPTSNLSTKVDYALFSQDRQRAYFVELKTDAASRRDEQDAYLRACERLGLRPIVGAICDIARKTQAHQKYFHLLHALAGLGYVLVPEGYGEHVYPRPRRGLGAQLANVEVADIDASIRVVYVQPSSDGPSSIGFAEVARYVDTFDDPVSRLFAAYLRRWEQPAGSAPPVPVSGHNQ